MNWRRNLFALWLCNFTGVLGITAMIPFVAFFLARDLHVRSPAELALFTGGAAAASGLGQALAAPVWGALGDRYGRRPLLLRAVLMGGVLLALTSLARSPQELLLYRFVFGVFTGQIPVSLAIVAAETPRQQVPRALGILNSATALAGAGGPALGAVVAGLVDVKYVFVVAGAGLLVSSVFVLAWVRESPRPAVTAEAAPRRRLRDVPPEAARTVWLVLAAQVIASTVTTAILPLVSLRFLAIAPREVALVTGIAFAIGGVMTALAGAGFGSVVARARYRATAIGAAVVIAGAILLVAAPLPLPAIIAAYGLYGFVQGLMLPVLSTMLGLEAPRELHSTVFGISASALAVGYTCGPLLGGGVAAAVSVPGAMAAAAALALALAGLLGLALREPLPSPP